MLPLMSRYLEGSLKTKRSFLSCSPNSPAGSPDNFDELFGQLWSKLVEIDFLNTVRDDPISLFEIQGLIVKLIKPEVPCLIVDIILDLKPLLEQVVQNVRQKQENGSRIYLRVTLLRENQGLVCNSKTLVFELEENAKTKNKLANLDAKILT